MNFAVPDEVRWIFLGDAAEATELVDAAARKKGFKSRSNASGFVVEIPWSLRKRRPAATIVGATRPSGPRTEIVWRCDPNTSRSYEHLLGLEAELPDGRIDYHGMAEVSAAAGLAFEGRRTFRAVAAHLQDDERAIAVARGKLGENPCLMLLTDRRLLLFGDHPEATPLVDAPLDSIAAMRLGKKSDGETLRIGIPPGAIVISNLGHGEGHGIASTFRLRAQELARTLPLIPSEPLPNETAP
ncbi:hypothetical protein FFF93_002485 [Arthrobacter sp. KBS0702]|uniref:hypothetical protein n=1 Tax=Arthrobacter sp. KBS0702 TaxID=2578107 RepID=UPI00110EA42C|nr:hypothetical protein [Arthrobacter sp. KBS0702]QDW28784.1 hypothetical protein FFF93_002485 [Arthrobacter sp. KBS0702]